MDINAIRQRFPALQESFNGSRAVFFDNPAGTQVPDAVISAFSDYFRCRNANTEGFFETSRRTDALIAQAHQAAADFLGADRDEVAFGHSMTALTFHLSRSLTPLFDKGDEIIVTRLDHDANVAPWQLAARDSGATLRWVDFNPEDCTLDMDQLRSLLNERTRLVAVGLASNAAGTVNDVASIVAWARQVGAWSFIDAVHYAPHGLIDVRDLDCDFLTCSPYKFFGPHSGLLYGKRRRLEKLEAYKVRPASDSIPFKWEHGTQNHEGMVGITAAIDYLAGIGREYGGASAENSRRECLQAAFGAIQAYERELTQRLLAGLLESPGVRVYGITDPARLDDRVCTFILRKGDLSPQYLAEELGKKNIFAWDGNYYALEPSLRLGVEESGGWLRIGLVHYNTFEEIDRFLDALRSID